MCRIFFCFSTAMKRHLVAFQQKRKECKLEGQKSCHFSLKMVYIFSRQCNKQSYIKNMLQTATDEHFHLMTSNHGSTVLTMTWTEIQGSKFTKKTRHDIDTYWSCGQGLLVVVPFPLILVPDEHFHCSEGWD